MSLDIRQLHRFVVRPALERINLAGLAAERLVIGTGLTESGLSAIDQRERATVDRPGPAFGLFQMERATHDWLRQWAQRRRGSLPGIAGGLEVMACHYAFLPPHEQMAGNLYYAAAMCRLRYFVDKAPLPAADDLDGMAAAWKRIYNSTAGAGREADFKAKAAPVMTLVKED